MAQLINGWMKKKVLEDMLKVCNETNKTGIAVTISVSNDCNEYSQNVAGYVSQTKEQQTNGVSRYYVLNGKTVWSDNGEFVAPKKSGHQENQEFQQPAGHQKNQEFQQPAGHQENKLTAQDTNQHSVEGDLPF